MGNRTYMEKTLNGTVVEWNRYEYNESNQLISEKLYNSKKTTNLAYTYDADGNRISLDRFDGSTGYYLYDAIESGLLGNKAGQIFLDYGDVIMGPPVTLPSSLAGIREAIKGNSDSEEMQRTATAGFYAGFEGQGLEYVQIISKADYQLSLLIVTQKGLNAAANPLTYVEYFRNFSPHEKLEAAKRTTKGAWNGEYDSALGRKTGAATLDYLLVAIGDALMKGESAACEVAESGISSGKYQVGAYQDIKGVEGMDAHHIGQKAVMKNLVENYDPKTAPAINVPKVGHTISGPNGIVSRNTQGIDSARQLLARDLFELKRVYPDIPNSAYRELIDMNMKMYPEMRK